MSALYGLLAEFADKEEIIQATQRAYAEGYRRLDAYSPYPIADLPVALGQTNNSVPFITLIGGMIGGLGAFFMEWWAMAVAYPINVGGRPFVSWPSFIPVTFELTVLCAALSAVIGMLALNHLPEPYHPVFNAPEFKRASQDRFFLCIEAADPKFNLEETSRFLRRLHPVGVREVEQ